MKNFTLLLIIAIIAGCGSATEKDAQKSSSNDATGVYQIPVSIKTLTTEKFDHYIEVSGTIEAINIAFISPETNGQIKEILVNEGDRVKKGQSLVKLNTSILNNQIKEIEKALELADIVYTKQENLWNQKIGSEIDFLKAKNGKETLEPYQSIVESVLTNVGSGSNSESDMFAAGETPNKRRMTVTFLDYEERGDFNTSDIMKVVSDAVIGKYSGAQVSIEKNSMGPPTGKAINIEISGSDFEKRLSLTDEIENHIGDASIQGIEGFKIDLDVGKPEMIVHIDRDKARRFELSTGQIASTLRTALFGKEISDYKEGEDEYPIQLRMMDKYRYNIPALLNQKMSFQNKNGKLIQIPISSIVDIEYSSTFGAVKRKNMDRVVTLYSNVIEGFNANEINISIKESMKSFAMPEGYEYSFTGEQEDQQESTEFLTRALIIAISLILILVSQFNSVAKPLLIIASILFSTIGVFGGLVLFNMDIVIIMTGIGIVSLAGIVVNNAIVLIDYIDLLKSRKRSELGMEEKAILSPQQSLECIVEGGKTRLRPVLLTAITTILGLIPMAVGLNVNFATLLSDFDPQFSVGGDMVSFWSPISWTVIFGLSFATFLTLIIVPTMYQIAYQAKYKLYTIKQK